MLTRVAVVEDTGEESKKRKEVFEIEEVDNNQEETRGERDTSLRDLLPYTKDETYLLIYSLP
jgi:hypothetical protein